MGKQRSFLSRLMQWKWLRMNIFRLLRADDVLIVARQEDDHIICYSPTGVIGRRLFVTGDWHRSDLRKVMSLLEEHDLISRNGIALELGANIGTQSLYLCLSGKFDRIVSVEPEPRNYMLLNFNIELNDLQGRITPVRAAVGSEDGAAPLFLGTGFSSGGNSLVELEGAERVEVPVRRLESILNDTGIQADEISFCWIDTEGYDHLCMRQLVEAVGPHVPVFAEIGEKYGGREEMESFLSFINSTYRHAYIFNEGGDVCYFQDGTAVLTGDTADVLAFNLPDR